MPKFFVSYERSFELSVEADSEELLVSALDSLTESDIEDLEDTSMTWTRSLREIKEKVIPEFGIVPEGNLGFLNPSLVEWDDWNDWNEERIEARRQAFGGCGWDDDQTLPLPGILAPKKGEAEQQEKESK